mgnify:FL=1|jgi:hypothetical protein
MKKLTILFLSIALGASVFGANPVFAAESGFFAWGKKQLVSLFTTSEQDAQEIVDEEVDSFLQALRNSLKKQGKKPCDTCYSMMEPGDPKIPLDHFNSSKYYVYKGK